MSSYYYQANGTCLKQAVINIVSVCFQISHDQVKTLTFESEVASFNSYGLVWRSGVAAECRGFVCWYSNSDLVGNLCK